MMFKLPGLLVTIRKPEVEDISIIARWLSDEAYLDNFFVGAAPDGQAKIQQAERMLQDNADEACVNKYFLVEERFSGRPAALAMLCKIDWKNRHAEYAYLIGAERYRTKLIAADINIILLNHFFHDLNLNKVYGFVAVSNAASLRLNHFGGKHDGTLRMHRFRGASISADVEVFSITKHDFVDFVGRHAQSLLKKHLVRHLIRWSPT
jgi:RimJ/RimL family protein N-acetyltransferase